MADAKIRIKVGTMEIEYEGDPAFLDGGIETLLVTMGELSNHSGQFEDSKQDEHGPDYDEAAATTHTDNGGQTYNFSTNAIATQYDSKSAADLLLCSVIQLQMVQGKDGCTRKEIIAAMKEANNFCKVSMRGGNLEKAFASLLKNKKLNKLHGGKYSLTASEKQNAEKQLAGLE
ncbi:hypothetical protein [Roseobacter litoralis]|nr:hypothetical protein [Roseobacter litoralis]